MTHEGLRVHIDRDALRLEQGLPVPGLIVRAEKPLNGAGGAAASRLAGGHDGE
jgi:hypothetical protein